MEAISPFFALAGGLLIGTAAALLLILSGRIAGVSGMAATAFGIADKGPPWSQAAAFIVGLPLGASIAALPFSPQAGIFAIGMLMGMSVHWIVTLPQFRRPGTVAQTNV